MKKMIKKIINKISKFIDTITAEPQVYRNKYGEYYFSMDGGETNFYNGKVFRYAEPFSEKYAVVQFKNERYGFINLMGKHAFKKREFLYATSFEYCHVRNVGLAVVKFYNGKYGFLNSKGAEVWEWIVFDHAEPFKEGYATVKINGKTEYMNAIGGIITGQIKREKHEKIIKPQVYVDKKGKYYFSMDGGETNCFDGKVFSHASPFKEYHAVVQFEFGDWGFLNLEGVHAFEGQVFSMAWDFNEEHAFVKFYNGTYGKIGLNGIVKAHYKD